jgi:LuxR family maltose regulon positive regulatory protein
METQILATKLFAPLPPTNLVSRPRLLEYLNGCWEHKCTLISAPAGYGKTTLLADWLHQDSRPVAWLSLDEDDNDIARFWSYVIAALQTILPEINSESFSQYGLSGTVSINARVTALINTLSDIFSSLLLLLDDYHAIVNQDIHQTMVFFLDNLPPHVHIVIASRTDPPIQIASLRAKGQLCEMRARDLQFTPEEAGHYFSGLSDLGVELTDIQTLVKKTEGWIAGLQLAAISLQRYPDKREFIRAFAGDDRHVADYLLEEVLHGLPVATEEFLLKISIVERLCAALCQTVTGSADSQEILEMLGKANLFLVPLDNRRIWYRFHHLFRDMLYQRLKLRIPTEQIANLHCLASDWYQANEFIPGAIHHALEADDMLRVVRLVENNIYAILERGELASLARRLDEIPLQYKGDRPWLNIALAWIYVYAGELKSGEKMLQLAEDSLSIIAETERNRAKGHIAALWAYIFWIQGQGKNAVSLAQRSLALLVSDELTMRAFVTTTLGGAFIQCDQYREAAEAKHNALELARASGDSHVFVLAASNLAYLYLLLGLLRKAELVCRDTLSFFEDKEAKQPAAIAQIYSMLSTILLHKNDLVQARQYAQIGLDYSKGWAQADTSTVCHLSYLDALIALKDFDEARRVIAQTRHLIHYSPWFKSLLESAEAVLNLKAGNIAEASRWAKESGMDYRDQVPEPDRPTYRNLVRVLLAEGKLAEAAQLNERLAADSEKSGSLGYLIFFLLLKSVIQLKMGDSNQALSTLNRAMEYTEAEGYVRVYVDLGEPMAHLLQLAIQRKVHPEYASKLLNENEMEVFDPQHKEESKTEGKFPASQGLIESLSRRELDVLSLIARGFTNQEIAQEFILSLYTVKSHARNIFGKLGVKNRTQAVAKARQLGLLPYRDI